MKNNDETLLEQTYFESVFLKHIQESCNRPDKKCAKLKIFRKPETDEWVVKVWIDGKYDEDKSYYTNDKKDAQETLEAMEKKFRDQGFTIH